MNLKESVMSGLQWSVSLRLLGQLFTWGVTITVIRLLTPADYGLMALASVFMAFLSMISELGLGAAVVQRKDLDDAQLKSILGFILAVSLLFYCILYAFSPIIANFYEDQKLTFILRVLAVALLFSGFTVLSQSLLLKKLQYKKIAVVELISAIAGSVCTLSLALFDMGVWALVDGYLCSRFFALCGYQLQHPFFHIPQFSLKGMGPIFSFSSQVTLSRIIWYIYTSAAATMIIGKVLGKDVVGIYGVGLYLASLPMEKVGGILNQVAFPAFSELQDAPALAGEHFLKAVRAMSLITIPVFWGMSSIAPEIVGIFLGDRWIEAIFPLQIIALVVPLRMVYNILFPALMGLGKANVNLINEIIAVLSLPLAFLIATYWGLIGVTLVWLLVFPVVVLINFFRSKKYLHLSLLRAYHAIRGSLLAGALMYLSVYALRITTSIHFSMVISMSIYIAVGSLVYLGMTFFFNRHVFNEAISLFRK